MAKVKKKRYKNALFLKALGQYCRQMRTQRGYSIDRLAKVSKQLSPGTIDRLERGLADSQILVLLRYAEALNCSLLDLFLFVKDSPEFSVFQDQRIIPYEEGSGPPPRHIPVYPIRVVAGLFHQTESYENVEPLGWVDANIRGNTEDYFATFIQGDSMSPKIESGDLVIFKKYTGGSRQGRIFLIQARGLKNSETGESFVIKKYHRVTPARSESEESGTSIVHLISENTKYPPIVLVGLSDDDVQTLAEFVRVIK